MADPTTYQPAAMSFGRSASLVTPDDDADLPGGPVKAVVALGSGDLAIIPMDGSAPVEFVGVVAGFMPPYMVRRVMDTGTSVSVATVED